MNKSFVGLKRTAMVIMYILAVLQLIGAISAVGTYNLDAGSMAWNWIWVAIGFVAAILLTLKSRGAVTAGSFIALASGILSLASNIYSLNMASSQLSSFGLEGDIANMAIGVSAVFLVIGSCLYFLVFGLGIAAARRMGKTTSFIPMDTPQYAAPNTAPQQTGVFCSKCGAPNTADAGFCSKCGEKLTK